MTKPTISPRHGRRTAKLYYSDQTVTALRGIFKQGISQETAEPVVTGPQRRRLPRLSPDGAWILFVEIPKTAAGPSTPAPPDAHPCERWSASVSAGDRNWLDHCALAPRKPLRNPESSQDEKQLMVTAFDPLKGRGKVLRTIEKDPASYYAGRIVSRWNYVCDFEKRRGGDSHSLAFTLRWLRPRNHGEGLAEPHEVLTGPLTERGFTAALSRHKAAPSSTWI